MFSSRLLTPAKTPEVWRFGRSGCSTVLQGFSGGSALWGSDVLGSSCSVGDGCWPGMSVSRGVRQSRLSLAGRLLLGPVFGIGVACFFCRPGHLQYVLGKTGCQPFLGPEL